MPIRRFREEMVYHAAEIDKTVNVKQYLFGEDAVTTVDIALFREGDYRHWLYGDLEIDRAYLSTMISNFNNKVNPTKPSANVDHMPHLGGYGWIDQEPGNLYIKDVELSINGTLQKRAVLYGKWRPNRKGRQVLQDEEYAYISAEIHPNFSTPELVQVEGGKAQVEYGPCLTGFALTNRPFIPNMPSIIFNVDGVEHEVDERFEAIVSKEDPSLPGMHFFSVRYNEQPQDEPVNNETDDRDDEDSNDRRNDMNFTEYLNKYNQFSDKAERASFIDTLLASEDGEVKAAGQQFSAMHQMEVEREKQERLFNEKQALLEQQLELSRKSVAEMKLQLAKAEVEKFSTRINQFCDELAELSTPAVAEEARLVFSNFKPEQRDAFNGLQFQFSRDGQEESVDVLGLVKLLFSKLPREAVPGTQEAETPEEVIPQTEDPQQPEDTNEYNDDVPEKVQIFANKYGWPVESVDKSIWDCISEDGNYTAV